MICKDKKTIVPTDRFGRAGHEAEKQMAFYLRRAFGEATDVFVFNDLRFVRNGEAAQLDHLVLHRYGFFVVESKSVTGTIEVNGNLEFVRVYGQRRTGMKSPLVQVRMQADLLQSLLNDHKEGLRAKRVAGLRQPAFLDFQFNTLVAISDQGVIQRKGSNPGQLVKADQVSEIINELIARHDRTKGIRGLARYLVADKKTSQQILEDDVPVLTETELNAICEFLLSRHQEYVEPPPIVPDLIRSTTILPPPPAAIQQQKSVARPSAATQTSNACRHCLGADVEIRYGKYGYYLKCRACDKNTKIQTPKCAACASATKLRKQGTVLHARCTNCGSQRPIF